PSVAPWRERLIRHERADFGILTANICRQMPACIIRLHRVYCPCPQMIPGCASRALPTERNLTIRSAGRGQSGHSLRRRAAEGEVRRTQPTLRVIWHKTAWSPGLNKYLIVSRQWVDVRF